MKENEASFDEPPGCEETAEESSDEPPQPWGHVGREQWNDWRWQLSHRLESLEDFAQVLRLSPAEVAGLSAPGRFRVDVTPYFASLMDPDDPRCPLRLQVVPTIQELEPLPAAMTDSLGEDSHSPVPGLVHRYPDRALMLVTTHCASYCRFCTRDRLVGDRHAQCTRSHYKRQLEYLAATPRIRDVLLSGGDPLTLPQEILEWLLHSLRAIPHIEIIRIGTRVPVFLPQRINADLVDMLRKYHPLWMNIHFNHPRELAPAVEAAVARLANAGIPLGSQTVLMAGINDCPSIITTLMQRLVKNRVRPYYLYQCDLNYGAGHFRTPVSKGIEIMEALRGHTSGYAIPTFCIDVPEGGGKIPILPNYILSMSESNVVVRNYEGFISTYAQPASYDPHDSAGCAYCQSKPADVQQGVAGLLAGRARTIVPEGWHRVHHRSTGERPGTAGHRRGNGGERCVDDPAGRPLVAERRR